MGRDRLSAYGGAALSPPRRSGPCLCQVSISLQFRPLGVHGPVRSGHTGSPQSCVVCTVRPRRRNCAAATLEPSSVSGRPWRIAPPTSGVWALQSVFLLLRYRYHCCLAPPAPRSHPTPAVCLHPALAGCSWTPAAPPQPPHSHTPYAARPDRGLSSSGWSCRECIAWCYGLESPDAAHTNSLPGLHSLSPFVNQPRQDRSTLLRHPPHTSMHTSMHTSAAPKPHPASASPLTAAAAFRHLSTDHPISDHRLCPGCRRLPYSQSAAVTVPIRPRHPRCRHPHRTATLVWIGLGLQGTHRLVPQSRVLGRGPHRFPPRVALPRPLRKSIQTSLIAAAVFTYSAATAPPLLRPPSPPPLAPVALIASEPMPLPASSEAFSQNLPFVRPEGVDDGTGTLPAPADVYRILW